MDKPNIVTRFLKASAIADAKMGYIDPNGFIRHKDMLLGELSVFNIDEELANNNIAAIYKMADEKIPNIAARGDMNVCTIEQIQYEGEKYLELCDYNLSKHCNIKPIPSNKEKALDIANELALISKLHIR